MRKHQFLLILTLGCWLATFGALQPVQAPLGLIAVWVPALVIELSCPHVAGAGFFSLAPALYFYIASRPDMGVTAAGLSAFLALGARTLFRGSRQPLLRQQEMLNSAAPVALALAVSLAASDTARLPALGTVFALSTMASALGFQGSGDRRTLIVRGTESLLVGALCGGYWVTQGAILGLAATSPVLLLPYLLGTPLGLAYHTAQVVEKERESAHRHLQTVQERLQEVSKDHQSRTKEVRLFRRFADSFLRSPDFRSVVKHLAEEAEGLVKPATLTVYARSEGAFQAVYHRAQTPSSQPQPGLEKVIERCFQANTAQWRRAKEGTGDAVALPIEGQGVLFLAWRRSPQIDSETLRALLALTTLAGEAMATAGELDQVQQALNYHSVGHAEARQWMERFDVLLAGVRSLAGQFSSQQVLETLRELAVRLVPHDFGAILVGKGPQQVILAWPEGVSLNLASAQAARTSVTQARRPLTAGAENPLWPGVNSHLAAPIMADETALGAVVLGKREGVFDPGDLESLALAAVQTAILLDNCRLYEEAVESKTQLERSQAQLVQSSKLAAVGQLAAGIAHELNTPLGAILLRVDSARLSLKKNQPESADEKLEIARQALLSARDIVSKLLTYSGEDQRKKAPCKVQDIVANAVTLVESQLLQQDIRLQVAPCPGQVLAHPNELTQVVINLLLNARDAILAAAPQGTINVFARVEGGQVHLEVEDSGPGVPADVRPRIFEPFFTTKAVGCGTGLGLWISHQIAVNHGGSLSLAEGLPTRFVLTLPSVHDAEL